MPEYKPLIDEFAEMLEKRFKEGEIKEITKETYLRDASRLFESVIWALSEESLIQLFKTRGLKGNYGKVVRDLKRIVDKRDR